MSARTPREQAQAIVVDAYAVLPDPDIPESAQADFIEDRIVSRIAAALTHAEAERDQWRERALGSEDTIVDLADDSQLRRVRALEAHAEALARALEEIMPRYREMFEHIGLGPWKNCVARQVADAALAAYRAAPPPRES